jgi:hypothetical protein
LQQRAVRFVPDDVLTIGVDVTVFGEQNSRELSIHPSPAPVEQLSFDTIFPRVDSAVGSLGMFVQCR